MESVTGCVEVPGAESRGLLTGARRLPGLLLQGGAGGPEAAPGGHQEGGHTAGRLHWWSPDLDSLIDKLNDKFGTMIKLKLQVCVTTV